MKPITTTPLDLAITRSEPVAAPLVPSYTNKIQSPWIEVSDLPESKANTGLQSLHQPTSFSDITLLSMHHDGKAAVVIENARTVSKVLIQTPKSMHQNRTNTNIAEVVKLTAPDTILRSFDHKENNKDSVGVGNEKRGTNQKPGSTYHEGKGFSKTSTLRCMDDKDTTTRKSVTAEGIRERSSSTHYDLHVKAANKVATATEVPKLDPERASQYSKPMMGPYAMLEETIQGGNASVDQTENSFWKNLSAKGSVEDLQGRPNLDIASPDSDVKSSRVYLQPKPVPLSLVPNPDPTVSGSSAHQLPVPRPRERLLYWRALIEKGIGINNATRKGIKEQVEQSSYNYSKNELVSNSIKVALQPGHIDAQQNVQGNITNQIKKGLKNINELVGVSHAATSQGEIQIDGIHGSTQDKCKNMTQAGITSKVKPQKAGFVQSQKQFQPVQQRSTEKKAYPHGQRKWKPKKRKIKQDIASESTGQHVEREFPQEQESSMMSTSHQDKNQTSSQERKQQVRKFKRIVPGFRGTSPSTTVVTGVTGKVIEPRVGVVMNTEREKVIGESGRKPQTTPTSLNQTESSTSSIHQSNTITSCGDQKNSVNSLIKANQKSSNLSNQFTKMNPDGIGRTGRGARGRNWGRLSTNHHTSSEKDLSEYRVEPKSNNRRPKGYQPLGSTSSNPGASEHSAQNRSSEKRQMMDKSIIKNAPGTSTKVTPITSTSTEQVSEKPAVVMESSQSGQVSEERTIILDSSPSKQPYHSTQSNAPVKSPNLNSAEGSNSPFSPRGIESSSWAKRSVMKPRFRTPEIFPAMDEQISIIPNGNWDSSDNTTQPRIRSSSGYHIELKNLPKYRFQGPPSSLSFANPTPVESTANGKTNSNSAPHQRAPEKKLTIASNASSKRSDHMQSPIPPVKSVGEDGYVPPHLRINTPKVAISKVFVAVPKLPVVKSLSKIEPATNDDTEASCSDSLPQNQVSRGNANFPRLSSDKGKKKVESSESNLRVNNPVGSSTNDTMAITFQNLNGNSHVNSTIGPPTNTTMAITLQGPVIPHPLAGQDGRFAPAPPEWLGRPSFNAGTRLHVQSINNWMSEQVSEAVNNPVSLNTNDPGFETGEALAAGDTEFASPIDSKEHETHLPDDDFTHAKHHETANSAAKKLHFKVRQNHLETKAERKAYRNAIKLAEANYVPIPNPHVPLANIFLRPAEAKDIRRITEIYNHYVGSSVVVAEREPMDESQWRARWEDAKEQRHAFIVAVQMSQKGGGYNRRNSDDVLAGFAYADDYGNNINAYRYTAELQFYVANWIGRSGVGKSLVDRMLAALDPCYDCRKGAPFEGGENWIWYEQGGVRLIKKVIISIPYWVKDESALKWQKEWLSQFEFEQVAIMPGVGYKFGKELNVAILMKTTGTMVPMGT